MKLFSKYHSIFRTNFDLVSATLNFSFYTYYFMSHLYYLYAANLSWIYLSTTCKLYRFFSHSNVFYISFYTSHKKRIQRWDRILLLLLLMENSPVTIMINIMCIGLKCLCAKVKPKTFSKTSSRIHYHYFQLYRRDVFSRRTRESEIYYLWGWRFFVPASGLPPLELTTHPIHPTHTFGGVEIEMRQVRGCSTYPNVEEILAHNLHERFVNKKHVRKIRKINICILLSLKAVISNSVLYFLCW